MCTPDVDQHLWPSKTSLSSSGWEDVPENPETPATGALAKLKTQAGRKQSVSEPLGAGGAGEDDVCDEGDVQRLKGFG